MKLLKKIEIFLKNIIDKIAFEYRRPYNFTEISDVFYFEKRAKILLLRHDKIGDLIVSTPFIRILRNRLPNAQIDILLSKSNISAKKCVEKYINKYWIYNKKKIDTLRLLRNLQNEKYDLVIDLFDNASTTSAFFIKYVNPTFALGIDKKNSRIYDYTVPMLDRFSSHIVERIANLLLVFGIEPSEQNLDIEYPVDLKNNFLTSAKKKRFGINLAGSSDSRFWGIENNIKLIEFIQTNYIKSEVRVFATGKYLEVADKLKSIFPEIISDKCDNFDDFVYEVSKCDFIISPDTSIVHLASAFKIPSIIFYVRKIDMSHAPWYPFNSKFVSLETQEDSISMISFESVKEALKQFETNF